MDYSLGKGKQAGNVNVLVRVGFFLLNCTAGQAYLNYLF